MRSYAALNLNNRRYIAYRPCPETQGQDHSADEQAAIPLLFARDRIPAPTEVKSAAAVVGFYPDEEMEGRLIAVAIADHNRAPRIGVLAGDDEASRQMLSGVRKGLGARAEKWISKVALIGPDAGSTETSLRGLRKSGATVLVVAIPSAVAVRAFTTLKAMDWMPPLFVGTEVARTLQAVSAAERAVATEARSLRYLLDANDPYWSHRRPYHFEEFSRWDDHRGVQAYTRFVKAHVPGVDPKSEPVEFACSTAQLLDCWCRRSCNVRATRVARRLHSRPCGWPA